MKRLLIGANAMAALLAVGLASPAARASEPLTHDGFFLSLELGGGMVSAGGDIEVGSTSTDTTITGGGVFGGLLLGGTPAPGLVIGGGTQGHYVPSPTVEVDGNDVDVDEALSFGLLGPFVQYYPDPNGGLFIRGLLGFASLNGADDDNDDAATGVGLTAGVGYEFWVGDEWSIGVLGRFSYASVSKDVTVRGAGDASIKYNVLAPGLLATFTYH